MTFAIGSLLGLLAALADPPPIAWHPDLAHAEAAAVESGRAMLVVFR